MLQCARSQQRCLLPDLTGAQQVVYLVQACRCYNAYNPTTPESRRRLAEQLQSVPENFFDMRQIKPTPKYPDFKRKATGEGLWLNSAPAEVQQLVSQWDANQSAGASQV